MRKLLLVCILIFGAALYVQQSSNAAPTISDEVQWGEFCNGWNDGFKEGYCYGKGYGCISPIPPICPIPRAGENTYRDGYNRGFLRGRSY